MELLTIILIFIIGILSFLLLKKERVLGINLEDNQKEVKIIECDLAFAFSALINERGEISHYPIRAIAPRRVSPSEHTNCEIISENATPYLEAFCKDDINFVKYSRRTSAINEGAGSSTCLSVPTESLQHRLQFVFSRSM